ncbi:transmembrane protein 223 [Linepithema humile]|uniref:transmembrane protein 223 n=1 Tax=Linepithema humile TaxID=83485 RepID=UPI0006231AF3|nr:PREDICTED: transmembrane protein 223 [Linepithema humile]
MLGVVLRHSILPKVLLTEPRSIYGITQKYLKNDKDILSTALIVRTFLTKYTRLVQPANFLKSSRLPGSLLVRQGQTLQLDVNLNVRNNVLIYKYENDRYFRMLRMFAIGQLFGWSILALYTYSPTFLEIFNTDVKFKNYIRYNGLRLFTFIFSAVVGPIMYAFIHFLCARNIKYMILHKGGKTISITTHHLWKKCCMNLPIEMVKSVSHRTDRGVVVPLKLKNKRFHYALDKKGTFVNPNLFDHIVG